MKAQQGLKFENTNFDGDWEENCSFCGKPQKAHQEDLGEFDGKKYLHRHPCPNEQDKIIQRKMIETTKTKAVLWSLIWFQHFWEKLTGLAEFLLVFRFVKDIFVTARGWYRFQAVRNRRKFR